MAIRYVDLSSGDDVTGTGTNLLPYKTVNKCITVGANGDEIRIAKTAGYTNIATATCTFTRNSNSITTSASLVGTVNIGDYIGKPTAAGNGSAESFYRIIAVAAGTLTIEGRYAGTTGAVASINRVVPVLTGVLDNTAMTISKQTIISGGWTLATIVQDGETWFKVNGLRTVASIYGMNITATSQVSKINIVESNYLLNIAVGAPNSTITNVTTVGSVVYGIAINSTGNTFTNIFAGAASSSPYGSIYIGIATLPAQIFSNVIVNSFGSNAGIAITTVAGVVINGGITTISSGYAVSTAANNVLRNIVVSDNYYGLFIGSNCVIENCTVTGCFYGVYGGTALGGSIIKNLIATNCTYGIYLTQFFGMEIEDCIFNSNVYDIYTDHYCSGIRSINCSHTTPVTLAYVRGSGLGAPVTITECSIDAPSLVKAFVQTSIDQYVRAQYLIQNSFNGINGSFFGKMSLIRDATTNPISLTIQAVSNIILNYADLKIAAAYVNQNIARTISYDLKALSGAWAGTIIPKLKLNAKTIATGTPIISLTTSYQTFTISATLAQITSDGELSLEFNYNANNVALKFANFTVV